MATSSKKKTTGKISSSKKVESSKLTTSQKVTAPKKTSKKKETPVVNTSEVDSGESSRKTRIITRKYLYAVGAVVILVGVLFASSKYWVVAWVDNKPITKFELYSLLEKRDDNRTKEELIVERLLTSEGAKKQAAVSDSEVNAEIKKIEEQQGGAQQLDQILGIQKLSREDFRKLVKLQLLKQKLFGEGVNIADQDVDKYIEENKDSIPASALSNPESSEAAQLKENVKEQLKQMKINENFNNWLNQNLNSSRVSRN